MQELKITLHGCQSDEKTLENLENSLKLKLPVVTEDMFDGPVSICGGGLSLRETLDELRGPIWACNGTYDWLLSKKIVPEFMVVWDAGDRVIEYLQNPHPDTTFLIASQCKPEVFEKLKDHKVIMWHAACDILEDQLIKYKRRELMISGGGSIATRIPFLAYMTGHREIHLFGVDSSLGDDDKSHVGEGTANRGVIDVVCGGLLFRSPTWMAGQAQEFTELMALLSEARIKVHGSGLLPHIARLNGLHYHNVI